MDFCIVKTNIVNVVADAVVLPANSMLKEGSGASRAIYEAAGRKQLTVECKELIKNVGKLEIGDAVPTSAYGLEARYIIHAVVPKWIDGESNEYDLLSASYIAALEAADMLKCKSIVFPLLASGHNGYDAEIAFAIAKESIIDFKGENLEQIILVIYDDNIGSIVRSQGYYYVEILDQSRSVKKVVKGQGVKIDREKMLKEAVKVLGYLKEPENRKKILKTGEAIAQIAIAIKKKDMKGVIKLVVQKTLIEEQEK